MENSINTFPSFSSEKNKLQTKIDQFTNDMSVSILSWAKNNFEGKIISFGHKKDIIKIDKIVKVTSGHYFYLKIIGKALRYMFTNNGFESIVDRRCLHSYTKTNKNYYSLTVCSDGSFFDGDYEFISKDIWKEEVKKANNINKWLHDKCYESIYMHDTVVYIKDNELHKHTIVGFDSNNGMFKILYDSPSIDGTRSYCYDYRMGSELIKV